MGFVYMVDCEICSVRDMASDNHSRTLVSRQEWVCWSRAGAVTLSLQPVRTDTFHFRLNISSLKEV